MAKTWKHSKLGTFTFDDEFESWKGEIKLPAFKAFTYDGGDKEGVYELALYCKDPAKSPAMIELVLKIVENQAQLPKTITQALWAEFTGKVDSPMWWSDGLDEVAEGFEYDDLPAPKRAEDLFAGMKPSGVDIYEDQEDAPAVFVDFTFHAGFEEEHGLSIVSDGKKVLGTGYQGEWNFYDSDGGDEEDED